MIAEERLGGHITSNQFRRAIGAVDRKLCLRPLTVNETGFGNLPGER